MKPRDLERLLAWAEGLTTPGVLVCPQPLIAGRSRHEANMLDYTRDYCRLLAALGSTGHDIVVMTGDVHYGRVTSVELGARGATLHEVVSSPLSNLTYLNAWFATNRNRLTPRWFPDRRALTHAEGGFHLAGWRPRPVNHYPRKGTDESRYGIEAGRSRRPWVYPGIRTREHLMTVSFARHRDGSGVQMTVKGWLIRDVELDKVRKRALPRMAFRFSRKLK